MFRFVARFARVRIEDSSRNRFALNGIQRDFFGGIFSRGILSEYQESGGENLGVKKPGLKNQGENSPGMKIPEVNNSGVSISGS